MLTHELLLTISEQYPCRDAQIQTLSALLTAQCIVVYGLESTGKSTITRLVLEAVELPHAIVDSKECITGRQLLEQTVASAAQAIGAVPSRCESLATLQVQLSKLLQHDKLVLVFDGIDMQREAPQTLIPALARMAESASYNHCNTSVTGLTCPDPQLDRHLRPLHSKSTLLPHHWHPARAFPTIYT